jgi:acyl-CoA synthetase (AMP-forming)/AMP-acid ligase II
LDGACGLNEPGELWLRAGSVAAGYWNNPKANAATFVHGWLRTGDRFRVDEQGYFWFADRAKVIFIFSFLSTCADSYTQDTLKISGAQVSPLEIEKCLLSHPGRLIIDVTVAGVSGGRTSDEKVPRAWIVLSPMGKKTWGKEKAVKELERWHQENLSKYKWLRGGIEIVDEVEFSIQLPLLSHCFTDNTRLDPQVAHR